ncbi:hypothetical protein ACWEVD_28685 [Nocardia thailandica]
MTTSTTVEAATGRDETESDETPGDQPKQRRQVTLSLPSVILAAVAVAGVVATVVFGVLWSGARGDLQADRDAAAQRQRAQQIATDYAVGASDVDAKDLDAWVGRLKAGTTPELAAKFDATAGKLKEILVPMQWKSTGTAAGAQARTGSGGTYLVDVFIDVDSTSVQATDPARTTVHYVVTVDAAHGWKVVDVGGSAAALPLK